MSAVTLNNKTIFITGSSGFIGSNLAKRILAEQPDAKVVGLDNMNDYYDVRIKEARLVELQKFENYVFIKGNLADKALRTLVYGVPAGRSRCGSLAAG